MEVASQCPSIFNHLGIRQQDPLIHQKTKGFDYTSKVYRPFGAPFDSQLGAKNYKFTRVYDTQKITNRSESKKWGYWFLVTNLSLGSPIFYRTNTLYSTYSILYL